MSIHEWHDTTGNILIRAAFDRLAVGNAVLVKSAAGTDDTLPFARLSLADRALAVVESDSDHEFRRTYRQWTSANGRFTVTAKALASDDSGVLLRKPDRKTVRVPHAKLSSEDVDFIGRLTGLVAADATDVFCKVVAVTDGDTIKVLHVDFLTEKVRLDGIDAPESNQPFGTQAKKALSDLCFGKYVRLRRKDKDRYGRTIGAITLGREPVNLLMVRQGYAWHFRKYSDDQSLANAEAAAREARFGLWGSSAEQIAPWDWRDREEVVEANPFDD